MPRLKGLFESAAFSDVTSCFAAKKVPYHKAIICSASTTFALMFGTEAKFLKDAKEVVLEGDDPEALMAVLRWMYTGTYSDDYKKREYDWRFHLQTYATAQKYQVHPDLGYKAYQAFGSALQTTWDVDKVWNIVSGLPAFEDFCESASDIVDSLRGRHLEEFCGLPAFKEQLRASPDVMQSCLDYAVRNLQKRRSIGREDYVRDVVLNGYKGPETHGRSE